MLVKDLDKIGKISERNEEKNRKFRSYLKIRDDKEIDRIVKPIYNRIREQIDCLECGKCCRKAVPGLSNGDLHKPGFTFRLFGVLEFSRFCPIIINVLEDLKAEFNFRYS